MHYLRKSVVTTYLATVVLLPHVKKGTSSLILSPQNLFISLRVSREDSKVSHYIINKIQQNDQIKYRIGDQMFNDIPTLLAFYKLHYLDTTPLIRPAPRKVEKVIAKYDFKGSVSNEAQYSS